jgi:hypothetical protein
MTTSHAYSIPCTVSWTLRVPNQPAVVELRFATHPPLARFAVLLLHIGRV